MPPTLIFDLDGTLSDPSEGIFKSTNHALTTYGYDPLPADDFDRFIGPPLDITFRTVVPGADDSHVHELVAAFRERYGRVGFAENLLYPGINDALEALRRHGAHMGVCTAKRRDFAVRILEMFDIARYFDFVDGGDVGIRKGDQLGAMLDQNLIDANAIMIGDRASDIDAAQGNALRAAGVLWGFGSAEELGAAEPDTIVQTPAELPDALVIMTTD